MGYAQGTACGRDRGLLNQNNPLNYPAQGLLLIPEIILGESRNELHIPMFTKMDLKERLCSLFFKPQQEHLKSHWLNTTNQYLTGEKPRLQEVKRLTQGHCIELCLCQ